MREVMPSGLDTVSTYNRSQIPARQHSPVLREFIAHDLSNHQRIVKSQERSRLDDTRL